MCGRFTLAKTSEELQLAFGLEPPFDYHGPRYNIAPGQDVLAVVLEGGVRRARTLRWGLVPAWADDPAIGHRLVNARAETVAAKPAFRSAYRARRCLIPADGWFEWQAQPGGKVPHWIHRRDRGVFAFAGLWEVWRGGGGEPLLSCTILTTDAAPGLRGIHPRQPVVVPPEAYDRWLDPKTPLAALEAVTRSPATDEELEAWPVSRFVNSPANEGPECIERVATDWGEGGGQPGENA
ncbi:MAG TPA: SOS response-associated peptidase [Longimicrobiales bacterium]